ncbi:extracellular solute-binding protein family 1 [Beutenbergia cavernae DSM 12333]|uniref:Extracellular solute-binding protein family 1 n=1 Tax=Beutenbergia cavernae (strain ATCC BAA-8 / DSM 12333 / CCUG 43141 / JCM 11478 / NBRC 16432 / NCIMB 13614 / HKI 0122) TaxID=471853 RepID=C5BVL7_BEUC1|nr:extracellular solute-binding protein [Beutenbergia cavernae]ACQ78457.1 extracellular solute-binding protein family 1 [Beutenbergia cavernae DSM 12333]
MTSPFTQDMKHPTIRRRALVVGAALSAGALVLTACGSGGDGGGGDADGPVDLRMVMWSANEGHHAIFEEIADAYIEANPDLVSSVTFEPITGGDYVGALTTQIAGGDAPDLAWVTEAYAAQFVDAGVFSDVTATFTDTSGYEFDDLLPGAMELWSADDNVYGYPFSNSPFGIYVNSDLLAAAGQPDPRELLASGEWTWDAVLEIAGATAESQGVAGFQAPADPYTQWNDALGAMWLSWGAAPWSEDGTQCTMSSPEMVEFFDWFHTQVFDNGAVPGPGEEFDFASGQVAVRMSQLSASTALGEDFAWDFLPLPEGPAGTVPVVGQGGVGVVSQGDNPEIAADFLAYFTNPESSELLAQYFPPPRASLLNVETLSAAAPALTEEQIQGTVIDQALDAVTKVGHPKMSEINDPVRVDLDALWVPDGDAQTVLDQVCATLEPIIAGS